MWESRKAKDEHTQYQIGRCDFVFSAMILRNAGCVVDEVLPERRGFNKALVPTESAHSCIYRTLKDVARSDMRIFVVPHGLGKRTE